jgi:hypothetical protein
VEDRGVQVVDVDLVLDRVIPSSVENRCVVADGFFLHGEPKALPASVRLSWRFRRGGSPARRETHPRVRVKDSDS